MIAEVVLVTNSVRSAPKIRFEARADRLRPQVVRGEVSGFW